LSERVTMRKMPLDRQFLVDLTAFKVKNPNGWQQICLVLRAILYN